MNKYEEAVSKLEAGDIITLAANEVEGFIEEQVIFLEANIEKYVMLVLDSDKDLLEVSLDQLKLEESNNA